MTINIQDYFFSQVGTIAAGGSTLFYWLVFFIQKKFSSRLFFYLPKIFLLISNIFFGLTLSSRWAQYHYFPLSNLYESLIFLCWNISILLFFFEQRTGSQSLSLLMAPLLFFIASFSTFSLPLDMQKAFPLVPSLQSNWLMMHVSIMMVSYATLLIGSSLSLFYLCLKKLQESQLLKNSFILFSRLEVVQETNKRKSFLEKIEKWSSKILSFGFPFLTLGILSGAVWANEAWGSYWSWDPKETWAFITWIIFASYLHARFVKGWQGEKAAWIGCVGFFSIWICYLGVNFLGKGLHSYGWIL